MRHSSPDIDPRILRLYDSAGHVGGTTAGPHQILLYPNVVFWGTINYDETTERLSPRTLDRTGMIFLGEADVKPPPEEDPPAKPGATARDIFEKFTRTAIPRAARASGGKRF